MLNVSYVPVTEIDEFVCFAGDCLMAVVFFDAKPHFEPRPGLPVVITQMKQLGETPMAEVWTSSSPVICGTSGDISFSQNAELLFGHICVDEAGAGSLDDISRLAYKQITGFIRARGLPHLLRTWNYFPSINEEVGGMERYKRFCIGRSDGLRGAYTDDSPRRFPAASAVGSDGKVFTIYFIASRTPGSHIENPRQVSAYRYPAEYGPKSPLFSRAIYYESAQEQWLFLAGTSSIVGHKTLHAGDLNKQFAETFRNIESLLAHAESVGCGGFKTPRDFSLLKVYLRDGDCLEDATGLVEGFFGPDTMSVYLRGDICRSDLMLEIECVGYRKSG